MENAPAHRTVVLVEGVSDQWAFEALLQGSCDDRT